MLSGSTRSYGLQDGKPILGAQHSRSILILEAQNLRVPVPNRMANCQNANPLWDVNAVPCRIPRCKAQTQSGNAERKLSSSRKNCQLRRANFLWDLETYVVHSHDELRTAKRKLMQFCESRTKSKL